MKLVAAALPWVVMVLATIVGSIWNLLTTLIMLVALPFVVLAKSIADWMQGDK